VLNIDYYPLIYKGIIVFHNGKGPMCLKFLEFIKSAKHPVSQYLESQEDFYSVLKSYKTKFGQSEGVSKDFEYYPIIFIKDKAYSGFNDNIKEAILRQIEEIQK